MQQSFTSEFMQANCGCYGDDNDYEKLMACSFMKNGSITLRAIVESEIPLRDKYWFVCKVLATKEENQQIAIRVAEIVLPIFEERRPGDDRPRQAIEAAKQFIAGHISLDELIKKRYAAAAAAAAAYATFAAATTYADDATYATYAAAAYATFAAATTYADAATYATYAAATYATFAAATTYADADAAAYAKIKSQLQEYLLTFCKKEEGNER